MSVLADDRVELAEGHRRKRRTRRKRKNRKRERLLYNVKWVVGGLAIGLPLLALLIYAVSRF